MINDERLNQSPFEKRKDLNPFHNNGSLSRKEALNKPYLFLLPLFGSEKGNNLMSLLFHTKHFV